MSCTPKAVRRSKGGCVCNNVSQRMIKGEFTEDLCRYRCCTVLTCNSCRGELCSWGPVGCKCSGGPRWARHRGMGELGRWDYAKDDFVRVHAAVKPSLARRSSGRNR